MARKEASYLKSLRFDPKLSDTWWAKYIIQFRFVIMLILAMVVLGIFGYVNIPRRLNPEINIAIVTVGTTLPGASPEDVEQLVTIPFEDALNGVKDIDTMTSSSVDGHSSMVIQFRSGVNGDKAHDDVKTAVDSVNLPEEVIDPVVTKLDFEDQPVWIFAVTTDSGSASLMRFSKILKDKIEKLSKVDRVLLSGFDEQHIEVVVDPEKAKSYGLNPVLVSQAIQKSASSYPAGTVETNSSAISLGIDRDIASIDDIRNTRISVLGQNIKLSDVAKVSLISKLNQNKAMLASKNYSPKETVAFFVFKSKNANIDASEKDARLLVNKTLSQYKDQFKTTTITNNAKEIEDQFSDLNREFGTTILLVFLLLLIFLGLRQAIISSITVPLTLLSSFAVIYALGISLNFLTTFSFLIALGVLIDDAIVVVAAMTRYFATGKFTPAQTGMLVWRDFIVPLVSTAITTIWAFIPLLLASGIIGEFIKTIPIVVTVTMASSTVIALFITLPLMIVFLKPVFPERVRMLLKILGFATPVLLLSILVPKNAFAPIIILLFIVFVFVTYKIRSVLKKQTEKLISSSRYFKRVPLFVNKISDKGLFDIEIISKKYMELIDRILVSKHGKRNTIIAIASFTLLAYFLVPFGLVKNEFFPKQDSDTIYVSGELPSGTNLSSNTKEMVAVLNKIRSTDALDYVIGETGVDFSSGFGRGGNSSSFLLTLHLIKKENRSVRSDQIAEKLREELKNMPGAKLTVQEQSSGPPAGADVQIKILGDDLSQLDKYANIIIQYLEQQPGVTNIDKSIKPGTSKLVLTLDKEKLFENNLTVDAVALWLRTYASGFKLDSIKFEGQKDKQDIVFTLGENAQTPEDLGRISIPTAPTQPGGQGGSVPLLSLGTISLATNPTVITREKDNRTISVTGSVLSGYNTQEINKNLEKFANTKLNLSTGYMWETGGANEENQKSVQSILQAMVLSFLLILVTMVIEFRSFRQTFIALMFIPLSISGVFYIFALFAIPLSFPALIGILALFGIVVRHAIVVIEKVNDNLRENMTLREAVVDAAGNRLEPVLLTSLAAIVGLIPITISNPLWRGLGGAIIAGLLFSGAIKLFFVPVMYYLLYPSKKPNGKKR